MIANLPVATGGAPALDVAQRAARTAGRIITEHLGEMIGPVAKRRVRVTNKGRNNIVTDVDEQAEAAILEVLGEAFPGFSVLAEESGSSAGSEPYTWYIDPVDGTRNFANGLPHLAVNVALSYRDEVVLGVTYDPARDEMFWATAGGGTWLNGVRMHASAGTDLRDSVLGFDMGYIDDRGRMLLEMLLGLWPGMQSVRLMGSAALGVAYAAVGRLQVYAHHHVQPWDTAPGILMVREAGGIATDLRGGTALPASGTIVAGGARAHEQFMTATMDTAWRRGG